MGGRHIAIQWQSVVIRRLRRAGAEQEGEEEEGHYGSPSPAPRVVL